MNSTNVAANATNAAKEAKEDRYSVYRVYIRDSKTRQTTLHPTEFASEDSALDHAESEGLARALRSSGTGTKHCWVTQEEIDVDGVPIQAWTLWTCGPDGIWHGTGGG